MTNHPRPRPLIDRTTPLAQRIAGAVHRWRAAWRGEAASVADHRRVMQELGRLHGEHYPLEGQERADVIDARRRAGLWVPGDLEAPVLLNGQPLERGDDLELLERAMPGLLEVTEPTELEPGVFTWADPDVPEGPPSPLTGRMAHRRNARGRWQRRIARGDKRTSWAP